MHAIDETTVTTCNGRAVALTVGNTVRVRVLEERRDGTVRAVVEGCGITLRQGAIITAPADAVRRY